KRLLTHLLSRFRLHGSMFGVSADISWADGQKLALIQTWSSLNGADSIRSNWLYESTGNK
ncbi:hypothetical protein MY4038_007461, partial [Beauveria bassiana]